MGKEFKKLFSTVVITAVSFFILGILAVKIAEIEQMEFKNTTMQRELSEPAWFELNNTEDLKNVVKEVENFDGNLKGFDVKFSPKIYEVAIKDNHGNVKNYMFVE